MHDTKAAILSALALILLVVCVPRVRAESSHTLEPFEVKDWPVSFPASVNELLAIAEVETSGFAYIELKRLTVATTDDAKLGPRARLWFLGVEAKKKGVARVLSLPVGPEGVPLSAQWKNLAVMPNFSEEQATLCFYQDIRLPQEDVTAANLMGIWGEYKALRARSISRIERRFRIEKIADEPWAVRADQWASANEIVLVMRTEEIAGRVGVESGLMRQGRMLHLPEEIIQTLAADPERAICGRDEVETVVLWNSAAGVPVLHHGRGVVRIYTFYFKKNRFSRSKRYAVVLVFRTPVGPGSAYPTPR